MPTIGVASAALFEALGQTFTEDEFQKLCFEFGIELDEVVQEEVKKTKTRGNASTEAEMEEIYKIEIPANRYDILCLEGLARALNVFREKTPPPEYSLLPPPTGGLLTMTVEEPTALIRPFIVCAVLRDCTFDERSYNSFLDLQDRMHHNVCRRRTLVAIGTHDLDTVAPPFRYRALSPEDIPKFVPLNPNDKGEFNGKELVDFYNDKKNNSPLKPYVPIIEGSSVYPVVMDSKDRVLSLPPLINGQHSRISASTKNVLIECTCTDYTKGTIVLNTMIAMFSQYSSTPFSVEPMTVQYPAASHPQRERSVQTPNLSKHKLTADVEYIQRAIGLGPELLPAERIPVLLKKMMLEAELLPGGKQVSVQVPITRPDVMHACDVMEDVAVAYSFNKIPREVAPIRCSGKQQPLSRLTDLMRLELAEAGYTEALTFALCSREEAFSKMRREEDGSAAEISNPKTIEFQVCRTSLLPGLFKTLSNNKQNPLPWTLFEVSDTVHVDNTADVGASNRRRLAVVYSDSSTSGFEIVHGLLERCITMLGLTTTDVRLRQGNNPTFMDGRCAEIYLSRDDRVVGHFGTVHPEVLKAFELEFPTSALELDLEAFLTLGVEGLSAGA
mmetsp:Transcript_17674/g.35610  ORF Transcript_17674/g.35610 Transcript_17674/m.35610 type:complete len:614 (-) Transcript_17674:353-2194(-)